jgi:transcription antitermination factor NusB
MSPSHEHTLAREAALRALYQVDLCKLEDQAEIRRLVEESINEAAVEHGPSREVALYARDLAFGVLGQQEEIDALIRELARNWQLERMAVIDRNVLRIGAYEIRVRLDVPRAVVINEAIELARKYSSLESGTFVNGILDQVRPEFGASEEA